MNNKKILSKGWKLLALNEICDLQNGYAFKSNDYINISNTLNCRMSNIRPDGFFDIEHNQKFLPDSYIEKYKQYLLKDGDVIIAMTDMATEAKILGVPTIVKTQGKNLLLNQRVGKLIIKKPELINFPYLKYVLNREQVKKYFLKFAGGGLQINLGKEDILSVEIPLPPIAEQKRIAEILDRTQSLISKRKEAIAKLDTLTQSIFLEMFGDPVTNPKGWKTQPLRLICDEINDCPHSTPAWTEHGVICLRTSNLTKGGWNWDDTRFVTEETYHERSKRGYIQTNDIILSREGTVGIAAIVTSEMKVSMGQRLVQVRPSSSYLTSEFLLRYLLYVLEPTRLSRLMVGSTSQHLNVKELRDLSIPNPPISLQQKFSDQMVILEKLKATHRASLSELQALFASLQHRAFRGEL